MKVSEIPGQQAIQFCGFIDVKIPSKGRKLGPWKAWRRQWCTVQRSTNDDRIELALGNNCNIVNNTIEVPNHATVCRSESRTRSYAFGIFSPESKIHHALIYFAGRSETESQHWMSQIRTSMKPNVLPVLGEEFSVSVIDNSFSRSCGFCGVYGALNLDEIEIIIRDLTTGDVSASWKWSQIEDNYLIESTPNPEDNNKIFIFQIRKCEDKGGGRGKLYLFCPDADQLKSAVCQYRLGRQHRLLTSPLPPTPPIESAYFRLNSSRRLSRSEGDLRLPFHSSLAVLHLRSRSSSRDRNSKSLSNSGDDEKETNLGKVARSLILASANFGLLLSTPGCSEPDSLHEYQCVHCDNGCTTDLSLESDDLPDMNFHEPFRTPSAPEGTASSRRVSGASVASGIYEEIEENPDLNSNSTTYENSDSRQSQSNSVGSDLLSTTPPPLPPRRRNNSERHNNIIPSYTSTNNGEKNSKLENNIHNSMSTYVPMSPISESSINKVSTNAKEKVGDINSFSEVAPPLPPRKIQNTESSGEYIKDIMCQHNIEAIKKYKQENKKHMLSSLMNDGKPLSEPDYLPMSQVPLKILSKPDDTYVVMANIINSKLSVPVMDSGS